MLVEPVIGLSIVELRRWCRRRNFRVRDGEKHRYGCHLNAQREREGFFGTPLRDELERSDIGLGKSGGKFGIHTDIITAETRGVVRSRVRIPADDPDHTYVAVNRRALYVDPRHRTRKSSTALRMPAGSVSRMIAGTPQARSETRRSHRS